MVVVDGWGEGVEVDGGGGHEVDLNIIIFLNFPWSMCVITSNDVTKLCVLWWSGGESAVTTCIFIAFRQ